ADGLGTPQRLTEPEPNVGEHWLPSISPDGEILLFTVRTRPVRIDALRLSTGERRENLVPGWKPQLTNTGHLIFATYDGTVMAAPFDEEAMEPEASPRPVVESVHVTANEWPAFFVADNGTLLYLQSPGRRLLEFVWVDRQGNASPVEDGWSFDPGAWRPTWELSPDGERIAYRRFTDGRTDLFIRTLSTGQEDRLTDDEAMESHLAWTWNGEEIVYHSDRGSPGTGWIKRADFTGDARELLTLQGLFLSRTAWSPGGEWVLIQTGEMESSRDILARQVGVDSLPRPLLAMKGYDETSPAVSPDGEWIAFVSDRSGRREVYLRPFPDVLADEVRVSVDGGRGPVWSPDGRELFFEADGGTDWDSRDYFVATMDPDRTGRSPPVRPLFTVPEGFRSHPWETLYDIHPDGERFLMAREVAAGSRRRRDIMVVKNWTRLLTEIDWR
ncbi:TolB family protein, partial [Gemmatimonadota bacterium]